MTANGHQQFDYYDVEERWAVIDPTAHVSSLAVVGSPAEWIGVPTKYPAIIGAHTTLREFSRVHAGCVRPTVIGQNVLLMAGVHVGHDSIIGDNVYIAPGAVLGGLVEVGEGTRIGIGALVLPRRIIGRNSIVGAGSVVTKDIPDNVVWAGNPAVYRKLVDQPVDFEAQASARQD